MTTHVHLRRRAVAALALMVPLAGGDRSQAQSSDGAFVSSLRVAIELCGDWNAAGPELVVTGTRLQWSRAVPAERAAQKASELARFMEERPRLVVAVKSNWVVAYDAEGRTAMRVDCQRSEPTPFALAELPIQMAVSEAGDFAASTASGVLLQSGGADKTRTQVARPNATGTGESKIPDLGEPPSALFWSGRRLVLLRQSNSSVAEPRGSGYSSLALPAADDGAVATRAFVYNGLSYVLRDGCLDIHLGSGLTPRLKQALCLDATAVTDRYMAVGEKQSASSGEVARSHGTDRDRRP